MKKIISSLTEVSTGHTLMISMKIKSIFYLLSALSSFCLRGTQKHRAESTSIIEAEKKAGLAALQTLQHKVEVPCAVQEKSIDAQFYDAALQADLACIKRLFAGDPIPSINIRDGSGMTALMNTTWQDKRELVEFLLAHGADPNARNNQGSTALILAIVTKRQELIRTLIFAGADIHMHDLYGWGPLFWATLHQNSEIMELLIIMGADHMMSDSQGKTAYDYAVDKTKLVMLVTSAYAKVRDLIHTETELDTTLCDTIMRFIYHSSAEDIPIGTTIDTTTILVEEKANCKLEDVAATTMNQLKLETITAIPECRCTIH